jgi:hypothetical protein
VGDVLAAGAIGHSGSWGETVRFAFLECGFL